MSKTRSIGQSELDWILSRVWVAESGCWVWPGNRIKGGHGKVCLGGRKGYVHRIVWQLVKGDIPAGLCVLHRCDNPICVNPKHLFLGTQGDNMRDMHSKGRGRGGRRRKTR